MANRKVFGCVLKELRAAAFSALQTNSISPKKKFFDGLDACVKMQTRNMEKSKQTKKRPKFDKEDELGQ